MGSPEGISYVKAQLAEGHSKEEIAHNLKQAGWGESDIEAAFAGAQPSSAEPTPPSVGAIHPSAEGHTDPLSMDQPVTQPSDHNTTSSPQPTQPVMHGGVGFDSPNGPLPPELNNWNWGAFLMSWMWGIGNRVWIAFLAWVPFVGMLVPFYLGIKGNELAWKNRHFESVEQFKAVQRAWAIWGVILLVAGLALIIFLAQMAGSFFGNLGSNEEQDFLRKADVATLNIAVLEYAYDPANDGSYPNSLDALVPSYISELPTDPQTGGNYRYSSSGNSFEVCADLSTGEAYCLSPEEVESTDSENLLPSPANSSSEVQLNSFFW